MSNEEKNLPQHIAIIMDGNGRWAKQRGMKRTEGHKKGAEVFRNICQYCSDIGIKYVTFYAFSTENWKRSKMEVTAIMNLLRKYLDEMQQRAKENDEAGYCIRFIGSREGMPKDIVKMMDIVEKKTSDKDTTYINIAVNYGGREEITHACNELIRLGKNDITEDDISAHIYTQGCPDPDLIVRTGGDLRTSNFLLWQSAYTEYYFTNVLWPDYSSADVDEAVAAFYSRKRRYGGV